MQIPALGQLLGPKYGSLGAGSGRIGLEEGGDIAVGAAASDGDNQDLLRGLLRMPMWKDFGAVSDTSASMDADASGIESMGKSQSQSQLVGTLLLLALRDSLRQ